MNNLGLFELFPPEYRDLLLRYINTLQTVLNKYDIAVFMARKAICFYKALVLGGFIEKSTSCVIITDRALTYNIYDKLKDKKIVIIDDVKIRGKSINKAVKLLHENKLKADIYILAQTIGEELVSNEVKIIENYTELSENDTKQLSKHIADFIAVSICPYNIDQPIYCFQQHSYLKIKELVNELNLINISSGLQKEYGVSNYTLDIPTSSYIDKPLHEFIAFCKIRFLQGMYSGNPVIIATPIVLFNEMNFTALEKAFKIIDNPSIQNFINNKNNTLVIENKFKILNYVISAQLMAAFIKVNEIEGVHRLDSNDNFVFYSNILSMIDCNENPFDMDTICLNDVETVYNAEFIKNEYLQITYDYLYSDEMKQSNYCDNEGKPNKSSDPPLELLILSDLEKHITNHTSSSINFPVFSSIIDVLIDMGILIPTIVYNRNKNSLIRAYKCGEVYALNEEHFKLFTYTLGKYLENLSHNVLGKIEFEKICVMFFRTAVRDNILNFTRRKSEFDDEYSICYSKFGPRVSTSRRKYEAGESSSLAKKLLRIAYIYTEEIEIGYGEIYSTEDTQITEVEKYDVENQYKIIDINAKEIENAYWIKLAERFARRFSQIYNHLFNKNTDEVIFDEVRNMYLFSYSELLTLMAIGLNKKEQLLSLLAEVHLFNEKTIVGDIKYILKQHHKILDGLISGMWKYMCFSQQFKKETKRFKPKHPIEKLTEELGKKNDDLSSNIKDFIDEYINLNRNIDLNPDIEPLIHRAGKLIYSTVYAIWFMSKKYDVYHNINGKRFYLDTHRKREYYFKVMEDLRTSIDNQVTNNTDEQNLAILEGLKTDSKNLLKEYHQKIAEGSRQENMDIGNGNNITNSVVIFGNVNNSNISIMRDGELSSSLENQLDQLKSIVSEDSDKQYIIEASSALKSKEESKFITILKKLSSTTKDILIKGSSELIIAYLKSNGII